MTMNVVRKIGRSCNHDGRRIVVDGTTSSRQSGIKDCLTDDLHARASSIRGAMVWTGSIDNE